VTLREEGAIERRAKARNPRTYETAAATARAVTVERIDDPGQVAVEFLMNALRLPEGVPLALFEERAGQPAGAIAEPLEEARVRGWLDADSSVLRPTALGLEMLNPLLGLFC